MYYVEDKYGKRIELTDEKIRAECFNCGRSYRVLLKDIMINSEPSFDAISPSCPECSEIIDVLDDYTFDKIFDHEGFSLIKRNGILFVKDNVGDEILLTEYMKRFGGNRDEKNRMKIARCLKKSEVFRM